MKNAKLLFPLSMLTLVFMQSCIEHEVIPPPEQKVELDCYFDGFLNSISLSLTQNVDGNYGVATKAQNILPAPDFSNERYYFTMTSNQTSRAITIGLGSVYWDGAVDYSPTTTQFNSFMANTVAPAFSDGALTGVEVKYTDANGTVWNSHENSPNFQEANFTYTKQESDNTGDYSKFICDFDCYVYKQDPVTMAWDSIRIQANEFRGWFKRN
jgi:hypothetical protein